MSWQLFYYLIICMRFGLFLAGDSNYSVPGGHGSKKEFTKQWLAARPPGTRRVYLTGDAEKEGRRGVWQPRFWEHTIEDEGRLSRRHFDYIHYNPVKHGVRPVSASMAVIRVFISWMKQGVSTLGTGPVGMTAQRSMNFDDIDMTRLGE